MFSICICLDIIFCKYSNNCLVIVFLISCDAVSSGHKTEGLRSVLLICFTGYIDRFSKQLLQIIVFRKSRFLRIVFGTLHKESDRCCTLFNTPAAICTSKDQFCWSGSLNVMIAIVCNIFAYIRRCLYCKDCLCSSIPWNLISILHQSVFLIRMSCCIAACMNKNDSFDKIL